MPRQASTSRTRMRSARPEQCCTRCCRMSLTARRSYTIPPAARWCSMRHPRRIHRREDAPGRADVLDGWYRAYAGELCCKRMGQGTLCKTGASRRCYCQACCRSCQRCSSAAVTVVRGVDSELAYCHTGLPEDYPEPYIEVKPDSACFTSMGDISEGRVARCTFLGTPGPSRYASRPRRSCAEGRLLQY